MDYEDNVAEISDYDIYYGDASGHEHDRGPIGWIERADGTEIKVCETSTENGNKVYVAAELTESMNGEIIFPGDVIPPEELTAQPPSVIGPQPPINAEFILHLLLRRDEQEAVIGDLLERYPKKYERLGKRRAQLWFCVEVFRSTWPLVKRTVFKATSLITLGEWIRRHIL
jgi:hypothetical protein